MLEWIVDTEATKYVDWDRVWFIDYRRILVGKNFVILGTKTWEEVLGVDTYQFKMHLGCLLLLHNVLYVPSVQCNLFSFISMLKFSFIFHFDGLSWTFI